MDIKHPGLRELIRSGRQYSVGKGQIMQSSDHRIQLNLVESGYIKRYLITNEGTISVQSIFGPDYVFPLTPVFWELFQQKIYSGPETIHYEAMSDASVYSIDLPTLHEAVDSNPDILKDLMIEAGVRLEDNIQRLENLSLKTAYKRIAHQLAFFASKFESNEKQGSRIELPLTHQDLADILSLTRETVTTGMLELQKKKLIKSGRHIIVPDLEKLHEETYS